MLLLSLMSFSPQDTSLNSAQDYDFEFQKRSYVWVAPCVIQNRSQQQNNKETLVSLFVQAHQEAGRSGPPWRIWLSGLASRDESLSTSAMFSTFKAFRFQQHRWSCGPANLFKKMLLEIVTNKKVTIWKKFHVIYHLFLVCKIVTHIVTFTFYCIITPTTIFVPDVHIPKWGCVYIPIIITLLNSVGTPRSFTCFSSGSSLKTSCHCIEPRPHRLAC